MAYRVPLAAGLLVEADTPDDVHGLLARFGLSIIGADRLLPPGRQVPGGPGPEIVIDWPSGDMVAHARRARNTSRVRHREMQREMKRPKPTRRPEPTLGLDDPRCQRVLKALESGPLKPRELRARTKLDRVTVTRAIRALVLDGRVFADGATAARVVSLVKPKEGGRG